MMQHAEKLEAVTTKLAGISTLIEGLISTSIEQSPALMLINNEVDRVYMEVEEVADWLKESAEGEGR